MFVRKNVEIIFLEIRVEDVCKLHGTSLRGGRWPPEACIHRLQSPVTWKQFVPSPMPTVVYKPECQFTCIEFGICFYGDRCSCYLSTCSNCLLPEEMYFPGDPRGSCIFLGLTGSIGLSLLHFSSLWLLISRFEVSLIPVFLLCLCFIHLVPVS